MEQCYGRVDGTLLKLLILESHSQILAIQRETESALVHVQKDPQSASLLESLTELGTVGCVTVTKLANTVESPAELIVRKGSL
jgi:hypothetical protein